MNHYSSAPPHDQHRQLADDFALDAMLRHDAAGRAIATHSADHIDNNGFSDRVMVRVRELPATHAIRGSTRLVIIVSAAVAALLFVMIGNGGEFLIDALMDLATKTITSTVLGLLTIVFALVMALFSLLGNER